jgi:4-hydroxy-tetrahydrodipicolinate reductase
MKKGGEMMNIIIAGCAGRMGQRIAALAVKEKDIVIVGAFEYKGHPSLGKDIGELIGSEKKGVVIQSDLSTIIDIGDVIIDFTSPESSLHNLEMAVRHQKKIVIGTTGFSKEEYARIEKAGEKIAVVCAPNMSVGVNLLFKLTAFVASVLGDDYDVEIVEAHHRFKKDAPSGTAKELLRNIIEQRKCNSEKDVVFGRSGICGERKKGTIGVHAIRGGDIVGDHTVSFLAEGERVELTHKASSRDAFAKGALVAARFVHTQKKGLYTMQDVLGLK